jgi:hypothetical protein
LIKSLKINHILITIKTKFEGVKMKFTKFLTLIVMVFAFAFAGFAQDTTKTEAPKPEKKHHMMKKSEAKEKGAKESKGMMKKMSKKGKKSAKKADADTTAAPVQQQ